MSVESDSSKAQSETVEDPGEIENFDHTETPRCEYHPSIEAESGCDDCGKRICAKDMTGSGTVEICNDCFLDVAQDAEFGNLLVWPLAVLPIVIVVIIKIVVLG